jgi:cytochrome c oxidase assembly protein subunit 15
MRGHDIFRTVAVVAVLLTYITILLGGNVAASDSGLSCPQWPSCQGTYTPAMTGGVTIEWSHRLSAFTLSVTIVVLFGLALMFERRRRVLVGLSGLALATVAGQAIMGGVVVLSDLSPWAVVVHLGLATVLFGVLVLLTLLANLRSIPRRWLDWMHTASAERPVTDAELKRAQGRDVPLPGTQAAGTAPRTAGPG